MASPSSRASSVTLRVPSFAGVCCLDSLVSSRASIVYCKRFLRGSADLIAAIAIAERSKRRATRAQRLTDFALGEGEHVSVVLMFAADRLGGGADEVSEDVDVERL